MEMSDLEKIKAAYDEVGIHYVVRMDEFADKSYLFLCAKMSKGTMERANLDILCRTHKYIEFESGKLASY